MLLKFEIDTDDLSEKQRAALLDLLAIAKKKAGDRGKNLSYTREFEQFWNAFPSGRKVAKKTAYTSWQRAIQTTSAAEIIAGAIEYANSELGKSEFVQGPAPWLNQHRWEDDRSQWKKVNGSPGRASDF